MTKDRPHLRLVGSGAPPPAAVPAFETYAFIRTKRGFDSFLDGHRVPNDVMARAFSELLSHAQRGLMRLEADNQDASTPRGLL